MIITLAVVLTAITLTAGITWYRCRGDSTVKPLAVNYHFHRLCNYNCMFCFHVNTNPDIADVNDAKRALKKLKDLCKLKVL